VQRARGSTRDLGLNSHPKEPSPKNFLTPKILSASIGFEPATIGLRDWDVTTEPSAPTGGTMCDNAYFIKV